MDGAVKDAPAAAFHLLVSASKPLARLLMQLLLSLAGPLLQLLLSLAGLMQQLHLPLLQKRPVLAVIARVHGYEVWLPRVWALYRVPWSC